MRLSWADREPLVSWITWGSVAVVVKLCQVSLNLAASESGLIFYNQNIKQKLILRLLNIKWVYLSLCLSIFYFQVVVAVVMAALNDLKI